MARTTATNFSGGLQFPYATAATDVFHKEDIQTLAQAVDQHDHTAGKGHSVNTTPANASITNAMLGSDVARANLLTNPGFENWQRGAGPFTANSAYTSDRWQSAIAGTDALSISRDTANVDTGSRACAACTFSLGTGAGGTAIGQQYNAGDGFQVAGRVVSASVRVKTATASAVRVGIFTDGAGGTTTYSSFHTGGGAYQTLTVTVTVPTNATTVSLYVFFAASCTAYIDNAMLVVGSQAADYAPLHPADDLARCLRYYQSFSGGYFPMVAGYGPAAAQAYTHVQCVHKPVAPTVTKNGTWAVLNCAQPTVLGSYYDSATMQIAITALGYAWSAPTDGVTQTLSFEANP